MENMDLNIEVVGKTRAFAIALSVEVRKFFQNRVSDFFFLCHLMREKGKLALFLRHMIFLDQIAL